MILILGFVLTFIISVIISPKIIKYLTKIKFGQSILEIGPSWHKSKKGTPTMGGVIFSIPVLVVFLVLAVIFKTKVLESGCVCLIVSLLYGLIGWIDDFIKVKTKKNQGLTSLQKILLQTVFAVGLVAYLALRYDMKGIVNIPFTQLQIDFGIFYYIFAVIVILGTVNGANLTDGIDGLATSVTLIIMVCYCVIASYALEESVALFAICLAGGLFGFLMFNRYPAKVFMGDTGSLFLGGAVASIAMVLNMPLIIIIIAFIYFWETLSDIIQVGVYKLTKKRVFKMAPYHHHLEQLGYSENKIVLIFSLITLACAILAYFGARSITG